jgi:hypothetical protein
MMHITRLWPERLQLCGYASGYASGYAGVSKYAVYVDTPPTCPAYAVYVDTPAYPLAYPHNCRRSPPL